MQKIKVLSFRERMQVSGGQSLGSMLAQALKNNVRQGNTYDHSQGKEMRNTESCDCMCYEVNGFKQITQSHRYGVIKSKLACDLWCEDKGWSYFRCK